LFLKIKKERETLFLLRKALTITREGLKNKIICENYFEKRLGKFFVKRFYVHKFFLANKSGVENNFLTSKKKPREEDRVQGLLRELSIPAKGEPDEENVSE